MPKMSAGACTGVVLSHLLADRFLSGGPMSLLWPLEVGYATGHSGWGEVVRTVAFDGWQDNGIILAAVVFIVAVRFAKNGLAAAGDARGPRHAVQPAAARRTLPFKG